MPGIIFPEHEDNFFSSGSDDKSQVQEATVVADDGNAPKEEKSETSEKIEGSVTKEQVEPNRPSSNWMQDLADESRKKDEEKLSDSYQQIEQSRDVPSESAGGEVSPQESEQIGLMWEVMEDEFKFPRLEAAQRPKSIEDFARMVRSIVDANARPRYSHPEVENFDKYVSSGGDPYQYMRSTGEISYENIKLETDYDRQMVVGQHMRLQGYPDATIKKTLEGYVKSGTLADVANDSLAILQNVSAAQKQQMVQQQQQEDMAYQKAVRDNIDTTVGYVEQAPDILGVKLTRREKDDLLLYMYKEDQAGQTQFAKDLMGDVGNIVKTAFLLRYGPRALEKIETKAQMNARDKLRAKIAQDNVRQHIPSAKARKQQGESRVPMWELTS